MERDINTVGFLNVDKPAGVTSFGVCDRIKKHFALKKTGHTGTLDPIAKGVLVVAVNHATKFINYLNDSIKEYDVEVEWGYRTDTYDITGKVLEKRDKKDTDELTREKIESVISQYRGTVRVKIPPFSAKKRNGKPLYKYARKGKLIKDINKTSHIYGFNLISRKPPYTRFFLKASRGTYVRSLVDDMGLKLGVLATLKNIKRTRSGQFPIESAVKLDKLLSSCSLCEYIVAMTEVFTRYPEVSVSDKQYKSIVIGLNRIPLTHDDIEENSFVMLVHRNKFIGLAQRKEKSLKFVKILPGIRKI